MSSPREALFEAVLAGDLDRVRSTFDAGVSDINALDSKGHSVLHWAVFGGYLEIVRLLLDRGADPNVQSSKGVTPLWSARDFGMREIIDVLLTHGARNTE